MVRKRKGAKYANGNYKSYQKAYESPPRQKSKRATLNKENRKPFSYTNYRTHESKATSV